MSTSYPFRIKAKTEEQRYDESADVKKYSNYFVGNNSHWFSLSVFSLLLFLHFGLFCFVELQPVFTSEPSDPFAVLEGNNITLEWSYDLAGGSFLRVEFVDVTSFPTIRILEVDTIGQTPRSLVNDYIGRVQVNVTTTYTSITILGANRTVDSKDYEFEVVLSGGSLTASVVTISVQYDPEFASASGDQAVVEGGPSIILECIPIGEPLPNITWTRLLDNGSDSNVLFTGEQFVLDNNRSSTGTYRCTADNGIGTAPNRTIAVGVTYKPENVMLMVNDSNICEGDIISINCSADGKPLVHTYQLFENDIQVPDSDTKGVWKRTMSAQGNFTYRCVANNTVGTSDKNVTVSVNVPAFCIVHNYKPENFKFATSKIEVCQDKVVNFTCSADGNPAVQTYQLFENDTLVTDGSNSHGLWNKIMSTGGVFTYKCVANNIAGTGQSESVTVIVKVPSSLEPIQNKTIIEGSNVTLSCNASGIPPSLVSWIKVGGHMRINGKELVFTNINRIEAGAYMCEASNQCGNELRLSF
ncbi:hemicentin-1-like [Orbicella faveolata]|uniref:hemicentin-1-like n=1 Tax=Orbicella faveolata TaxID=48498 RepID=UPI0009E58644|nr:hemicentin-1-like [Orbicella faveolata]